MKILVAAPTGSICRKVVDELLAPEFSIRLIAREPSRLPEAIRTQVEVVQGSPDDFPTLRRALEGMEALFWRVPRESRQEVNVRAHYERFATVGCHAIRAAKTPRVVTISAGGTVIGRKAGSISAMHAMEDILNQSGAAIRHLRCGWFMENFLQQGERLCRDGIFSYPIPGDFALPMVACCDVADVALKKLVRRDWAGVTSIPLFGPEDHSFNQAAFIMGEVLQQPLRYTEVSADESVRYLVRSGASVHYARSVGAMFAALAQGILRTNERPAESPLATTLADWTKIELLPKAKALRQDGAGNTLGRPESEGSLLMR